MLATAVNRDGQRVILGLDVDTAESGASWLAFLRGLVARGLTGVQLAISDTHGGLTSALAAALPGASWQRSSADIGPRREVPVGHLRRRERTLAA
jgi:putative transposase